MSLSNVSSGVLRFPPSGGRASSTKRLFCGMVVLNLFFGVIGQARSDFIYWTEGPVHELLAQPSTEIHHYTDDTQMMIGVAETLATHGEIQQDALAQFPSRHNRSISFRPQLYASSE